MRARLQAFHRLAGVKDVIQSPANDIRKGCLEPVDDRPITAQDAGMFIDHEDGVERSIEGALPFPFPLGNGGLQIPLQSDQSDHGGEDHGGQIQHKYHWRCPMKIQEGLECEPQLPLIGLEPAAKK